MRFSPIAAALGLALVAWPAPAQTTQGLISGRVTDARDGRALGGAQIAYWAALDGQHGAARADASGYYVLAMLSPGTYRVRVSVDSYQPRELHELTLPVAGFLEMNFRLRPLADVWEQGQYRSLFAEGGRGVVRFFGPDLDQSRVLTVIAPLGARGGLEPSLSEVVGARELRELPLAGRDAYTMLVALPGVTSDAATARGLGLSVNGQRPSASSFLLDGVENNNYLVTGPLTQVAPEALGEYRVSLNNFSAEYGRTSGFLANAVTRAGGNRWHGVLYHYLKNDALSANGFQQNRQGLRRTPLKESQPGFSVAGPAKTNTLFASFALEHLRSRTRADAVTVNLPSTTYRSYSAPGSMARWLLDQFRAPYPDAGRMWAGDVALEPPLSLDRWHSLARIDHHLRGGTHRLMGRLLFSRLDRPDFIWSPYPDFTSGLRQTTAGLAIALVSALGPGLSQEARAGVNDDDLHWDRAHPEIATLTALTGTLLPGSPAFYAYRNRGRNYELADNLHWVRGRHILKAGGGVLLRRISGYLTAGRDGRYIFRDFLDFGADWPRSFEALVARNSLPQLSVPDYRRRYGNNQFFLFGQDSWKVRPRLVVNGGVRYENFGAPRNTGAAADAEVVPGQGATFGGRLAAARLVWPGNRQLYTSDANNLAARAGFSWNLSGEARTLLRGAYGIFYDRPFDNLWQNLRSNSIVLVYAPVTGSGVDFLQPVSTALAQYGRQATPLNFPNLTLYQPGIRDAYVHSYFAGLQRRVGEALVLEVNGQGSLGRKLITTDLINRGGSMNPTLGHISYRANQGLSNFHALSLVGRYATSRLQAQAAYTWSHSIDNQSDPLAGDFFDLTFTRLNDASDRARTAAFTRQFDSGADRANSDFDQRHNLVTSAMFDTGSRFNVLLRNWRLATLAAFRSGFPFSVIAGGGEAFVNNRPDIAGAQPAVRTPVAGGLRLLDAAAFAAPPPDRPGNTGRNAFRGPGMFNVDLSVSRRLALPFLGEAGRVTFRADAFNVLNHANLNNPNPYLASPGFGVAPYGREGRSTGFPALVPFRETARQIQVMLRVEF